MSVVMKPKIGFVGLGVMGMPMMEHLASAGYALAVTDASRERRNGVGLGMRNVKMLETAEEVGRNSDILVTMVPNGEVVRDVMFGEHGAAKSLRTGSLVLDTSSSEPWLTRSTAELLRKGGVAMVDAPVSGAVVGAKAAELVFMVGGQPEDLERVRPLLEVMGKSIHHLGEIGAGDTMKCLNNLVTAVTLTATGEAMIAGVKAGLNPGAMTDVLNESTGGSWCSENLFYQRVLNRKFDDPFKLSLMLKDMRIALDLARKERLPMVVGEVTRQLWNAADLSEGEGASVVGIIKWLEKIMRYEIPMR